ncbi:Scr1 family TA system antitoxin-like transcriptional regulator [Nocardia sp. NPDC058379]|uniref:Scr1 family TA system antitoxin-like transcriptional regulator n=1 Tax=unclassified Nocardia TaxID=2637762 RepID=UPI0036475DE7
MNYWTPPSPETTAPTDHTAHRNHPNTSRPSAIPALRPNGLEGGETARLHRQALLDAHDHRFRLLFSEAALLRTVGSPLVMASQIRFLREFLAARTNVEIGIIPIPATFVTPATLFVINDMADPLHIHRLLIAPGAVQLRGGG